MALPGTARRNARVEGEVITLLAHLARCAVHTLTKGGILGWQCSCFGQTIKKVGNDCLSLRIRYVTEKPNNVIQDFFRCYQRKTFYLFSSVYTTRTSLARKYFLYRTVCTYFIFVDCRHLPGLPSLPCSLEQTLLNLRACAVWIFRGYRRLGNPPHYGNNVTKTGRMGGGGPQQPHTNKCIKCTYYIYHAAHKLFS